MISPGSIDTANLRLLIDARVVPRNHFGRQLAGGLLLLILVWMLYGAIQNKAFGWQVVGHYLFDREILRGLWLTLWLTALVSVLGFIFGAVLAVMRRSANTVLRSASICYVWIFRSTPLLVQLLFFSFRKVPFTCSYYPGKRNLAGKYQQLPIGHIPREIYYNQQ